MRIRHILPEFGRIPRDLLNDSMSGIVRSAVTIATRQSTTMGYQVELLGLNRDTPADSFQLQGVEMWATRGLKIGRWNTMDWRYFLPLYIRSMRRSADIAHVHDNPFLLNMPRADKQILHFHTPISTRVNDAFVRSAMTADYVICNSEYIRRDFLESVPFAPHRTRVVHNAVDLRLFESNSVNLKERIGIEKNKKVILFVGQLSWQKGLIHLINALSLIRDDVALIVAGGSDLWQTINDPIKRAAVEASDYELAVRKAARGLPVYFLGTVPTRELKHVYASCDVFVCPSEWPEPFGMVNVEAMAASKPIVASRIGGIPEIVEDGETGLLVEAGKPKSFARALNQLLADDDYRMRLGNAGYVRAREYFNWERVLEEVVEIYQVAAS